MECSTGRGRQSKQALMSVVVEVDLWCYEESLSPSSEQPTPRPFENAERARRRPSNKKRGVAKALFGDDDEKENSRPRRKQRK